MLKIIPMKTKQHNISSDNFKVDSAKIVLFLKKLIAVILAVVVAVVGTTVMLQISVNFYQVAVVREMTMQDLILIATFSGASAGVIISNIKKMYHFFESKLVKRKDTD